MIRSRVAPPGAPAGRPSAVPRAAVQNRSWWLPPELRAAGPPLIVVGMHRAGTSMVAAMLGRLGLDMCGAAIPSSPPDADLLRSGYAEAPAYFTLNEQLLYAAGASWCRPERFLERREEPGFAVAAVAALAGAAWGPLRRGAAGPGGPWGWKDPRNSLTLPFWLMLFPQAGVLHVRRDPEAASASLHQRASAWQAGTGLGSPRTPAAWLAHRVVVDPAALARRLGARALRRETVWGQDPCLDLAYCRRLGDTYLAESLGGRELGARYRELWYEEAIADPLGAAAALADFAGLDTDETARRGAAALVRGSAAAPARRGSALLVGGWPDLCLLAGGQPGTVSARAARSAGGCRTRPGVVESD